MDPSAVNGIATALTPASSIAWACGASILLFVHIHAHVLSPRSPRCPPPGGKRPSCPRGPPPGDAINHLSITRRHAMRIFSCPDQPIKPHSAQHKRLLWTCEPGSCAPPRWVLVSQQPTLFWPASLREGAGRTWATPPLTDAKTCTAKPPCLNHPLAGVCHASGAKLRMPGSGAAGLPAGGARRRCGDQPGGCLGSARRSPGPCQRLGLASGELGCLRRQRLPRRQVQQRPCDKHVRTWWGSSGAWHGSRQADINLLLRPS